MADFGLLFCFPRKALIIQHAGHRGGMKSLALLISLCCDLAAGHPCTLGTVALLIRATSAQLRANSSQDVTSQPSVMHVQRLSSVSLHHLLNLNPPAALPRLHSSAYRVTPLHDSKSFLTPRVFPHPFSPPTLLLSVTSPHLQSLHLGPCRRERPEIGLGMSQQRRGSTMAKQPPRHPSIGVHTGSSRLVSSHLLLSSHCHFRDKHRLHLDNVGGDNWHRLCQLSLLTREKRPLMSNLSSHTFNCERRKLNCIYIV